MERETHGGDLYDPLGSHPGSARARGSNESLTDIPEDVEQTSTTIGSPEIVAKDGAAPTLDFIPAEDVEQVPGMPRGDTESMKFDGEDENPAIPEFFQRSSSPAAMHKQKGAAYEKVGEDGINRMHKFYLYETSTRFYLIGTDLLDKHYRVLKIDRTAPPGHLSIFEDDIVYDRKEMNHLLNTINDGNKHTGGVKIKCSTWGLMGFIRFTEAYYMVLITKRAQVAMLGGHYIYQVDGTELIPLTTGSSSRFQKDRNPEEARYLSILNNLDLTRFFYFSYSYDITRSLQQNIIRERNAFNEGLKHPSRDYQDIFVWNHYLLEPAREALKNVHDWCHAVIHGSIDQSSLDVFGRRIYITLMARRSRFFAGARFLKRGTNDLGYVANDVETEQIVSEALTTSFHAPGPRLWSNPTYTSYVQHRGSIPLYWTQDNSGVTPKPDIKLSLPDPFHSAAALHFDNLFERYGAPVYVLNLIKQRERTPRESKLLHEYKDAIEYLNQSLPHDKRIIYEAFDMARASKTRGQDVILSLEHLGEKVLRQTGFFHNGDSELDTPQVQNGVARTNCIDCLDRTNAAQFVIGKRALGRQLQALGVISGNTVEYDSDCIDNFTHMFHNHGDAIAMQYGGSHLVNTMATYRKINQWQSSSRDMVESFKRYYHNSFLDSQRQEACNLFLGNYIHAEGQPMLWDLQTDYYLHHADPRFWLETPRRDYITWYTPEFLQPRSLPPFTVPCNEHKKLVLNGTAEHDDYWNEYYRPLAVTSLLKVYAFRLSCPPAKEKDTSHPSRLQDASPFVVRKKQQAQATVPNDNKKPARKGVTILDPSSDTESRRHSFARRRQNMHLQIPETGALVRQSILRDPQFETQMSLSAPPGVVSFQTLDQSSSTGFSSSLNTKGFKPADKALIHQWTLAQFHENSLNPSVTATEEEEYERYIGHPLNLPLVVSNEAPVVGDPTALDFLEYLNMSESGTQPAQSDQDQDSDSDSFYHVPLSKSVPTPGHNLRLDTDVASIRSLPMRPTSSASFSYPLTPFSHPYQHKPFAHNFHHLHDDYPDTPDTNPPDLSDPAPAPTAASGNAKFQTTDEDIEEFEEFLKVRDNPLDVEEEDGAKKRYKAYRQWLRGKSFFKQSKVDPEWQNQLPVR
ncbi:phosphatidylinositol-3,5-bisphosphate 5-phosphatase [Paraconiothyrium brasiliense]|uniref:Phosphatidylinositol-3,5-bisphosphate 5-phosphatase n=1 Tax=Paraconiothyrium brasiliense TaxID=300254 RepID=A0ABR3R098_9PLEO